MHRSYKIPTFIWKTKEMFLAQNDFGSPGKQKQFLKKFIWTLLSRWQVFNLNNLSSNELLKNIFCYGTILEEWESSQRSSHVKTIKQSTIPTLDLESIRLLICRLKCRRATVRMLQEEMYLLYLLLVQCSHIEPLSLLINATKVTLAKIKNLSQMLIVKQ